MCEPISMGVLMGASALQQGLGARSSAKSFNEQQDRISAQVAHNATEAAVNDAKAIAVRESQEDLAASQAIRNTRRDAALIEGSFRAGAGSGGVEGLSIEALRTDFDIQESLAVSTIQKQREFAQLELEQQKLAVENTAQSRINAGQPNYQPVPSLLGTFLQVGTAAVSGYGSVIGIGPGGKRFNTISGTEIT